MLWTVSPLIAAFVIWRSILPLRIPWGWKTFLSLAALGVSCKYQIIRLLGGPMFFAPDLPGWLLVLASVFYSSFFFFFLLLFFSEIIHFILYLIFRMKKDFRRTFCIVNAILLGIALLLSASGTWAGISLPEVRKLHLAFPHAQKFTIALIADLHADRMNRKEKFEQIVRRVNALSPDVIVIAGDFADGPCRKISPELLPLRNLSAKYGVFAVPGNHEYYSNYPEWKRFLTMLGIVFLDNTNVHLPNRTVIAGITDPGAKRYGLERPDLRKALKGTENAPLKILLSHQPKTAHQAAKAGVDLQLSGHTHGGIAPLLSLVVKRFNGGFVSGEYRVGKMILYVSNGTSIWTGFPVRIFRPAEITFITVDRENAPVR